MPTPAEQQLQAIIDAAARAAVEKTTETFTALLGDAQTRSDQLASKNAALLSEKKALEGKPAPLGKAPNTLKRPLAELLAEFDAETDRLNAEIEKRDYRSEAQKNDARAEIHGRHIQGDKVNTTGEIVVDRADPRMRNGTFYREQRALAEKRGVPLCIVDTGPNSGSLSTSRAPKKVMFDHRSTRFIHKDEIAGQNLRLREQARRDGMNVVVFRDESQLPDDAMQAYRSDDK